MWPSPSMKLSQKSNEAHEQPNLNEVTKAIVCSPCLSLLMACLFPHLLGFNKDGRSNSIRHNGLLTFFKWSLQYGKPVPPGGGGSMSHLGSCFTTAAWSPALRAASLACPNQLHVTDHFDHGKVWCQCNALCDNSTEVGISQSHMTCELMSPSSILGRGKVVASFFSPPIPPLPNF